MVHINKKKKRTLDDVGKEFYNFDYKKEELIYKYVCCKRLKKKQLKKLNDDQKFHLYLQWEKSIYSKYKDYPKDKLINFSRYLNQRIRNLKPNTEYNKILVTICLGWFVTKILDVLIDNELDWSGLPVWGKIICWLCVFFCIIYVICKMINPIFEDNIEESLFIDYKYVIDKLLKEKT